MLTLQDFVGLSGGTLLIVCVVLLLAGAKKRTWPVRILLCAFALVVAWLPYQDLYLVEYLRALSGDLSISLMFVLALTVLAQFRPVPILTERTATEFFLLGLSASLVLYPMELGLTAITPYTLGYGSNAFYSLLLAATLAAWYFRRYLIAGAITFACLAYTLGLLESPNLWDYLLDPVMVFFTPFWLIRQPLARLFGARKTEVPAAPDHVRATASCSEPERSPCRSSVM